MHAPVVGEQVDTAALVPRLAHTKDPVLPPAIAPPRPRLPERTHGAPPRPPPSPTHPHPPEHEGEHAAQAEEEEEVVGERREVGGVERRQVDAALQHDPELGGQRKGDAAQDEAGEEEVDQGPQRQLRGEEGEEGGRMRGWGGVGRGARGTVDREAGHGKEQVPGRGGSVGRPC